jgi:hypothetical protein
MEIAPFSPRLAHTIGPKYCGQLASFPFNMRSMKWMFLFPVCLILIGCGAPPSKEDHIKQVRDVIAKAGGETKILNESRILFPRCSAHVWSMPGVGPEDSCFDGLPGIQSLGDVFYYASDHVRIRVHNSHRDTYFIYLLNPDKPPPANFERIAGNVGFIDPEPL